MQILTASLLCLLLIAPLAVAGEHPVPPPPPSEMTATSKGSNGGQEVPFEEAHLENFGGDQGLRAEPFAWRDGQKGEEKRLISEVVIDGRSLEISAGMATSESSISLVHIVLAAVTIVAILALAYPGYRVVQRKRAGPLAQKAAERFDQKDLAGATDYAKKAIRCDPRSVEAASVLAVSCLEAGKAEEAIMILERTRQEDDPLVQLMLTVSLREVGETAQARWMLLDLLERHPELVDIVRHTELIHFAIGDTTQGDHDEALPGYG